MTVQNPFQHILVSAIAEDKRDWDADHRSQEAEQKTNPFRLDLMAVCIMENIKAGIVMAKKLAKQPFQLVVDTFFPTVAILENLRNPKVMKSMQNALIKSALKASKGLSAPGLA